MAVANWRSTEKFLCWFLSLISIPFIKGLTWLGPHPLPCSRKSPLWLTQTDRGLITPTKCCHLCYTVYLTMGVIAYHILWSYPHLWEEDSTEFLYHRRESWDHLRILSTILLWTLASKNLELHRISNIFFLYSSPPQGFLCGSAGKESTCNVGNLGSIPGLGRSPGEGKSYPLQCSGLENSMDCIVHGVAKSQTQLSNFHFTSLSSSSSLISTLLLISPSSLWGCALVLLLP